MRHRLTGVQHRQCTYRSGSLHQLCHRRTSPGDIRMMSEDNNFDPLIECQRVQVEVAVIRDAIPAKCGTGAPGQFLPGNQVGMML